jgi:phage gp36-like protein
MYEYKYTTEDSIMRRLKGRLELLSGSAFGRTNVDTQFVEQLADQADARLEGVLKRVYAWPLKSNAHPFLAEFVELRVCCQIIPTYYQGVDVSDDRGFGSNCCKEADKLLKELLEGAIVLDGEAMLPSQTPAPLRPSGQTISGRYTESAMEQIDW